MPRRNADTLPARGVPAQRVRAHSLLFPCRRARPAALRPRRLARVPVQRLPDERVPHGDGLARAARRLFEWACLAVANIVSWNTLLLPGSRATRARKCGVSR
jgi:hypothetical protein